MAIKNPEAPALVTRSLPFLQRARCLSSPMERLRENNGRLKPTVSTTWEVGPPTPLEPSDDAASQETLSQHCPAA